MFVCKIVILNSSRIPVRHMLGKVKKEVILVPIVGFVFNAFT